MWLELTLVGLPVKLSNHYTTRGALDYSATKVKEHTGGKKLVHAFLKGITKYKFIKAAVWTRFNDSVLRTTSQDTAGTTAHTYVLIKKKYETQLPNIKKTKSPTFPPSALLTRTPTPSIVSRF